MAADGTLRLNIPIDSRENGALKEIPVDLPSVLNISWL